MMHKLVVKKPWCPFCGQTVAPAADLPNRKMTEFNVGRCQCGAVYSCDPTGHNIGAALVETLVYACGDNSDLAWELLPEEDYLTGRIENYDEHTHQVITAGTMEGRSVRGVLYFVRLHREISEIAERLRQKKDETVASVSAATGFSAPPEEPLPRADRERRRADKKLVRHLAEMGDEDGLVALCLDDRKALRLLQRLLYDGDSDNRWRTAMLVGRVSSRVATRDPGQVSELLHRLFEAGYDSAATPWGMIETIGAVVAARPDIFGAFTQYLPGFIGNESTRVQAIWALGEIAGKRPDLVRKLPFYGLFPMLQHEQAEVRGQTARLLGRLGATEASMQLLGLHNDQDGLVIWEDGTPVPTTVAEQAAKAMEKIQQIQKGNA
ncbi:DVU0298 family protein [Desulfofustis limnaeus]|jgi:hypothetical protein|uniref:PBS lyase n=1 Tax=Desulfofustis limnaeus TaxID=2740163 RepID=A0ABM7W5B0_9BACT|nr:DVU0298 family protein [Desulfofustis limnaeus]MDX9894639.1 PBS lyase [Desulfofustis sp.]BDD86105.1 PBS lyase [Desulfofustis limnaeus]